MLFRILADLTVALHLAFIVFVVCGGFLALRWRKVVWIHLPAAAWGAAIELGGWICPLTPLENRLRQQAGEIGYTGGFVEHYILPIVYPAGLTPGVQLVLAALVVIVNVAAYTLVIRAWRRA
jgi:hypothetical protein